MQSDSTIYGDAGDTISQGLMSSPADSPVKTFPMPVSEPESMERALVYGQRCGESFANFDRESLSWKTSQLCLGGDLSEFSETWPRAGLMRNGIVFPLSPLVPLTAETEFSSWLTPSSNDSKPAGKKEVEMMELYEAGTNVPDTYKRLRSQAAARETFATPSSRDWKDSPGMSRTGPDGRDRTDQLARQVYARMWPTPSTMDHIERKGMRPSREATNRQTGYLSESVIGALNPTWVEWLMGYPLGWTDLKGSETPSSRKSRSG